MNARKRNDPTMPLTAVTRPPGGGVVVVEPGSPRERRFTLTITGELIAGKDQSSDIVLDDPAVSRRHCQFVSSPEGVRIRDLSSRNGTFVGGIAVSEALLTNGVVVRLGNTELLFFSDPDDVDVLAEAPTRFGEAVGVSKAMRLCFSLVQRIAPTDLTVTIVGETGTGKDVIARSIHAESHRARAPLVVFDAGAVAPTLIESKLFGHVRGSFTGAIGDQAGSFETADGGTLFFDEIGELELGLQPKLLRALEQRTIAPLGSETQRAVDVRVIAATNRQLEDEVREGRFREDLFFRLSVVVVRIPPLRERKEDIPVLIREFAREWPRQIEISAEAMAMLQSHNWPGNVRELKNVLSSAVAVTQGDILHPKDFLSLQPTRRESTLDGLPLAGRTLEEVESATIRQTLLACGGNKSRAAKELGIATSTLYEKVKRYGL